MAGRGEGGFPARVGAEGVRHSAGWFLLCRSRSVVPFSFLCRRAGPVFLGGTFPGGTFLASDDFTKARLVTALRLYQGHVAPTCAKVETFAQVDSGGQSQDML